MTVTYAFAHYVLRVNGHFGTSATTKDEHWSTGFKLGNPNSDVLSAVDHEPFLETIAPAIQSFHTSAGVGAGVYCWLDELTIARVGTNGKYDPTVQETIRRAYPTPPSGNGTPHLPWSTALVISQRTIIPRGIASNGRTYWPTPAIGIDAASGRITPTTITGFLNVAKPMFDAINTAANVSYGASVRVSVVGALGKTGPARTAHVRSIRMDGRLDAIERRENDVPITYDSRNLA